VPYKNTIALGALAVLVTYAGWRRRKSHQPELRVWNLGAREPLRRTDIYGDPPSPRQPPNHR